MSRSVARMPSALGGFILLACAAEASCSSAGAAGPVQGGEGAPCYPNKTCDSPFKCDVSSMTCGTANPGSEGGACYPNKTCDDGLDCTSLVCVPRGGGGQGGAAGQGSGSGGGLGKGGTGGSGKPSIYDKGCSSSDKSCASPLMCKVFNLGAPGYDSYVCSQACQASADCGTPPEGSAVACVPGTTSLGKYCVLVCDFQGVKYPCPKGMVCGAPQGLNYQYCFGT